MDTDQRLVLLVVACETAVQKCGPFALGGLSSVEAAAQLVQMTTESLEKVLYQCGELQRDGWSLRDLWHYYYAPLTALLCRDNKKVLPLLDQLVAEVDPVCILNNMIRDKYFKPILDPDRYLEES